MTRSSRRRRYTLLAGVHVLDGETLRPANGRDFRHGAAVNQVRQGVVGA